MLVTKDMREAVGNPSRAPTEFEIVLMQRIAELEAKVAEQEPAIALCDVYYRLGCEALGQAEWDNRVRSALTNSSS